MSYEIVRNISKRKDNRIFITSTSNNVYPHSYFRWEYMPDDKCTNEEKNNKELYLFYDILGQNFHLSKSVNKNWLYALNRLNNYCYDNDINIYDLCELPYKDKEFNITALKPYYNKFQEFYSENKEGKYYLKCNLGYVTKVNKNNFKYNPYYLDAEVCCKDYQDIYNDYCSLSDSMRSKYDFKIEEYVLLKENNVDKVKNDLGYEL